MNLRSDPSEANLLNLYKGTGWLPSDHIHAVEQGWRLHVGSIGLAIQSVNSLRRSYQAMPHGYAPLSEEVALSALVERAMMGEELSYKALYLMTMNDNRYSEWMPLVEKLKSQYV